MLEALAPEADMGASLGLLSRIRQGGSPCFVCGLAPGAPACAACHADFFNPNVIRCARCALRIPAGEICGACLKKRPAFDAALSVGDYGLPLAGMIRALKDHARLELAAPLAELLAERAANLPADTVIAAVPLAFERESERGFNQAAQLARLLARRSGLRNSPDLLFRVRHSAPQQSLDLSARAANVRGAYAVRGQAPARVAVVDDVMTTGATLGEIAKVLKRAGAQHVTALVLARTP